MSANTITYEVHVKEGGRWVTQGHYGRGDREEALAHARSIERLKKQTVKVVRETFWAAAHQVEHVIVYRSAPQAPTAPRRRLSRPRSAAPGASSSKPPPTPSP